MSHWTKVKTQMRDVEVLKKALERMDLKYQVGDCVIEQYGTKEKAQIKLDNAVGFSLQSDGTYAMVGDFYHSRNPQLKKYYSRNQQFQEHVSTAYAVEETTMRLEEQGFSCCENEEAQIGKDGLIHMTFERY